MTEKETDMMKNNDRGFTLLEILIVTGIVTVSFFSIVGLVHRAITLYYNNKNILIANTMAEQGLELARYIRDDNWMTWKAYRATENFFAFSLTPSDIYVTETKIIDDTKKNMIIATDYRIARKYNVCQGGTNNDTVCTNKSNSGDEFMECPGANEFDPCGPFNNNVLKDCGSIQDCLKLPEAKLYKDITDPNKIFYRHIFNDNLPDYTNFKETGFSHLLYTEYRDGGVADETKDDYLHVESWVYYLDHGREKYFHIDTDLYDYSWRYEKK